MSAPPPLSAPKSKKRPPPKLPPSAFALPTLPPKRLHPHSIIDTHIHLWTNDQLESGNVAWPTKSQFQQLRDEHTLQQYQQVVQGGVERVGPNLAFEGAVFVQAEAKHDDEDLDGSKGGWDAAIDEIDNVCKAALASSTKILALVPWAPVHLGPTALSSYFTRLTSLPSLAAFTSRSSTPNLSPIRSCRYLLQDSPKGFFLTDNFIAGLKWLGEEGIAFDMTLDVTQVEGVLDDAVECVQRVREGQTTSPNPPNPLPFLPPLPLQTSYISSLFSLSLLSNVTLKLSGLLDSADPELVKRAFQEFREGKMGRECETLRGRVLTFLEPAVEAFGEERIIVGSDWPMFRAKTISLPSPSSTSTSSPVARNAQEESQAWAFEMELYRTALLELGLEGESLDRVFSGNAKGFYGIGI
ncbi:hypothetical protein BCR35DRAFT_303869 [Leucosporidium creatinivorum]|uniref:Amidohydrolase-related domain-containing protein n=1 Tax=Leucosporidium creatinivorum TaxID=106004 RepID=A0A1Y2FCT2_9BASI|nr:hypothetical protein BCR35DRAFT_303869 [Leucosporidium creatinivorum]